MRTDDELKQLARDLHAGRIFTDQHLRPGEDPAILTRIFMPLLFMNSEQWSAFKESDPAVIFEYLSEAGPREINGYPIFMSFKSLGQEEWAAIGGYYKKLKEASDAL